VLQSAAMQPDMESSSGEMRQPLHTNFFCSGEKIFDRKNPNDRIAGATREIES
jgi:hypothetical protein